MDLVHEVALLKGPSWYSNRTHWRDIEGYDLAVGPRTGGRLFPKKDERPDKPRKMGQIDRNDCALEIYTEESSHFDEDFEDVQNLEFPSTKIEGDDLKDVYGKNCFIAIYANGKRCHSYRTFSAREENEECEWHDFVLTHIGSRKLVALNCAKEKRNKKRKPVYGWRKKSRVQDKRSCNIFV